MKKINIAIDGPSAAGKSTIARLLAEKMGYVHLDTGAMYRCTALKAVKNHISLDDEKQLCSMLSSTVIELKPDGSVWLDGRDVSHEIRTEEISRAASHVSKLRGVRRDLVHRQQEMAAAGGFIMDGRDIGTVVLKDAEVKVFMTASPESRAERRYEQDLSAGMKPESVEKITEEIRQRDYQDTHRSESPLVKAADAVEIDTSDLTISQTVDAVYALCAPYLKEDQS